MNTSVRFRLYHGFHGTNFPANYAWRFAHSRYIQGYFVSKGSSLGEKFTLAALSPIPLERFS